MEKPKTAHIVIDMSHDFVADDGRLTCGKPAQLIVPYIHDCISKALDGCRDLIVFAMDEHKNGKDGSWPAHNDPALGGQRPYGKLNDWWEAYRQFSQVYYIPKTKYSAFWGTPLADILRNEKITQVDLYGVCTDICVVDTAAGAYYEGFKVRIHKQGVATFSDLGDAALDMAILKYKAEMVW